MGPIEAELRGLPCQSCWSASFLDEWAWEAASHETFCFLSEGKLLGLSCGFALTEARDRKLLPDLFSEAIEAAEALGL